MTPTRGTPERFAIRELILSRGEKFTYALLSAIPQTTVARIYLGEPITDDEMALVKKTLKERMTVT